MKRVTLIVSFVFSMLSALWEIKAVECEIKKDSIEQLLLRTTIEISKIRSNFDEQFLNAAVEIYEAGQVVSQKKINQEFDREYLEALSQMLLAMERKNKIENEMQFALTKVRYRKGLELIKMVYEKVLALDHHFSALQTYQNIAIITNPNTYPEFQAAKALLEKKGTKANPALQLPGILAIKSICFSSEYIGRFFHDVRRK